MNKSIELIKIIYFVLDDLILTRYKRCLKQDNSTSQIKIEQSKQIVRQNIEINS